MLISLQHILQLLIIGVIIFMTFGNDVTERCEKQCSQITVSDFSLLGKRLGILNR